MKLNKFALAAAIAASQAIVAVAAIATITAPAVLLVSIGTGVFTYARVAQ